MSTLLGLMMLIATATPTTPPPGGPPTPVQQPGAGDMLSFLVPLILAMGVFYFIMYRGQRKDRDRHEKMIDALKRNDKVQTVGGIIGTVVDVRDDEVVLKVDESSNVKVRFARGAIKGKVGEVSETAGRPG